MVRDLVVVLGDQLDEQSPALKELDINRDRVWMAEVADEARYVWSHKARIALFLSAMRQFRDKLRMKGITVEYHELDSSSNLGSIDRQLSNSLEDLRPQSVVIVEPGEWRILQAIKSVVETHGIAMRVLDDTHFLCSRGDFEAYARGRKQLRLEYFYREMRRRHAVLMDADQPKGGRWNFDFDNRETFGSKGPGFIPSPISFTPDELTRKVIGIVTKHFPDHPGDLRFFDWPVTPEQARLALDDFVVHRLPFFGKYQDAMWTGQPYLYHSRLSSAMNLKLLNPREVIQRAERAYTQGDAPLSSVEGFVRQILGWREYVRGVYWTYMPAYLEMNSLEAHSPLPSFYWTGDTDMNCLREVILQTLRHGYAHHIQRLMITGLYALLLGVHPKRVHEWYLAVYVDAVEWVELPNTLGMSQFADGGLMASKPYVATGKYIQRMSPYCKNCRYDPAQSTGESACPFTTLYWDFLMRNEERLRGHPRMQMQMRNLSRLSAQQRSDIIEQASKVKRMSE